MLVFVLLINTFFISVSYGGNLTTNLIHDTKVNSENTKSNQVNVTLNSEGGSLPLVTEKTVHTLPSENHKLLSLHKELGISKEKSVVPRKGVQYDSTEDSNSKKKKIVSDKSTITLDDTIKLKEIDTKGKSVVPRKGVEYEVKEESTDKNLITEVDLKTSFNRPNKFIKNAFNQNKTLTEPKLNNITMAKKPRVLSYDTLREQNTHRNVVLPAVQSSFKTITSDQMQSPNSPKGPIIKTVPMSASRHPGMIMPVVITILVVPMFAVLGYMALKRGQEAWKNRHYKRMDFLLDGMYND